MTLLLNASPSRLDASPLLPKLIAALIAAFHRGVCGLGWGGAWMLVFGQVNAPSADPMIVQWKSQRIHERFFTEGASAGDINGDGIIDLVAGPLWYAGPDFKQRHLIAEPREFNVAGYSDQFFSYVLDVNGDGAQDVLVLGFPGEAARLYVNPGHAALDQTWEMFAIAPVVDNESPTLAQLIPGDLPQIVCGRDSQYGYYQAGPDPTQPWTWHPISRPGTCGGRFAHGMGVGDVNGDGRLDILDSKHWWQQPAADDASLLWQQHTWAPDAYGNGGAQILVTDVTGNGVADIISSHNAHAYGLSWFEQFAPGEFRRHEIMGASSTDNPYGVCFSQLHALALADMDGDGLPDIVTGKRYLAHNGKDPGGLQEPVLYWFQLTRTTTDAGNMEVQFVPHLIHNDSGVGTEVLVTDLNGDGKPDVVSSSKRGLMVHWQTSAAAAETISAAPQRWRLSEGRDQSQYAMGLNPQAAAAAMLVPDGFAVDLIAAEPDLTQPIAMCFDARGRIWVIEGHTYPQKTADGAGRDRVLIFQDTNGDGQFDSRRVFAENLNLASGIEVGFGGVFIGAAPELLFYPDADHDGVPDGPPVVLLDGWGFQDTHETLNSFTWGPDGWLYGCHGVFTHSRVGKPGTADADRIPINAGMWRYHPIRQKFEVFAYGTSNPWGVDFNDQGEWFLTSCVIPHLFHVQQGARYQRQAGSHFQPYTYAELQTIADHAHYVGKISDHAFWGDNAVKRPAAATPTSMLGGGHAHCGLAIYNGDTFPPAYYGDLFFHNLHGHRVVREHLQRDGSGFVGRHRPDFALSQDRHFIGVGVMVGPDGALYQSDWHDPQTCHNRTPEIWDRTTGRLYRVRYGNVRGMSFNLWAESDQELVARLQSDNGFFARQSQRILHERFSVGQVDQAVVSQALEAIVRSGSQRDRLRAIWTAGAAAGLNEKHLLVLLSDADPYVRSWAVHFCGELLHQEAFSQLPQTRMDDALHRRLSEMAARDASPVVRRFLASFLQRLPLSQRWPLVEGLVRHSIDGQDRNLPTLIWYGLEPLAELDPQRVFSLAAASAWPHLLRFAIRRTANSAEGRQSLVAALVDPAHRQRQTMILEELLQAGKQRAGVAMPAGWPAAFEALSEHTDAKLQELVRQVAVQFGDASAAPYFRAVLRDGQQSKPRRLAALTALQAVVDPELTPLALSLLDDPDIAEAAIATLAGREDPVICDALLARFAEFSPALQTASLATLASRKSYASKLIEALESQQLDARQVPAFIVRQIVALGDESLSQRLQACWGTINASDEEKKTQITRLRGLLRGAAYEQADRSRGRALYEANCGKCHKLFGSGGEIGPDITGANRTNIDYWLENIVEPNALIGRDYQVTTFLMDDGRVISGLRREENDQAVLVQTATEQIVLIKSSIEEETRSAVSLMPEGQLERMTDQEVRELIRYLTGDTQVPLPGQTEEPTVTIRPDGSMIIEGEALVSTAEVSSGIVRAQAMRGFGPQWSGDQQLWWTDAKPNDHLMLPVSLPAEGRFEVLLYLTQAEDYGQLQIQVASADLQTIDLFAPKVQPAAPVRFLGVQVQQSQSLQFKLTITGKHPDAVPRYMVGLDRIELRPVP